MCRDLIDHLIENTGYRSSTKKKYINVLYDHIYKYLTNTPFPAP